MNERFMQRAIALAEEGVRGGYGGPFGAVVVKSGEIVGEGFNRVLSDNDPTAHAEVVAIREASRRLGSYWLEGCELYVNCQPCPMCMGAAYWARIGKVVFGATAEDAAAIGFADDFIARELCRPLAQRSMATQQMFRDEALVTFRLWSSLEQPPEY